MNLIHAIVGLVFKAAATVLLVFAMPHKPVEMPATLTLATWELGKATQTPVILSAPAPLILSSSTATSTSKKSIVVAQIKTKVPVTAAPATTLPATTSTQPSATASGPSLFDLNTKTRNALVNILCITGTGGYLKPISGTGVIIDPRGVVLTNAHIGQFFLLRDYPTKDNVQCVLRTGSPAEAMYTAELIYFPKTWLDANADKIIQENPTGTGEHDFSLLLITGRTNPNASLPKTFPYLTPYTGMDITAGEGVLLAGYSAGFLQGATISTNLYSSSAVTTIGQIFTFKDGGGADLVSVGGTIVSQKGSSGGAMVRTDSGGLAGLIVTATLADSTAQRDLRAITLRHINLSVLEETGKSLSDYLIGNLRTKADTFNQTTAPSLSKALFTALSK